ncbi:MAG: hypothetical protein R3336_00925, partial [Phycisphaeraceae bacterium]|nr:hypothetical protein [Phycisphaeraceae bacterium]
VLETQLAGDDPLPEDNRRWALVSLQRELAVRLSEQPPTFGDSFSPSRWLALVLDPRANGAFGIRVQASESSSLDPGPGPWVVTDLSRFDGARWQALRDHLANGGVVWAMPPVDATLAESSMTALVRELKLDWVVQEHASADGDGWRPATGHRPPELLSVLSADWDDLLQPVRIHQRVGLDTSAEPRSRPWVEMEDGTPWLLETVVGSGRLLVMTSAIHTDWTNLPTRPLFVPLVHETLRGLVAETSSAARLSDTLVGDRPWLPGESNEELNGPDEVTVRVQVKDQRRTLVKALVQPGIYRANGDPALVVNVDPSAGNLAGVSRDTLAIGLEQAGVAWEVLPAEDPALVLKAETPLTAWAWPLLWVVLGLMLLETTMARQFSHANIDGGGQSWRSRLGWLVSGGDG